ncbi:MAG: sulfatase [Candidatus Altiarchaeota archaeon]
MKAEGRSFLGYPLILFSMGILAYLLLGFNLEEGVTTGVSPMCPGCNILLVSIDTLRADHMGCYGYGLNTTPNIDSLSSNSLLFTRYYTALPSTMPSHATMFTSKMPYEHKLQENGQAISLNETTLAEVLNGGGYNTAAITSAGHLNTGSGLGQGFDYFDSPGESNTRLRRQIVGYTRGASETTDLALEWLESNPGGKFFMFLHYWDPHSPYTPPKKYDVFRGASNGTKLARRRGGYDGEVFYVDSEFGRIIDYLEKNEMLDNTLVVVTSDHGESLGDHGGYFGHGPLLYEHQIRIPLIIYCQGVFREYDKLSLNTQLMPTILEMVGVGDSASSSPSLFEDGLQALFFESDVCSHPRVSGCYPPKTVQGKLIGVRKGDFKLIQTPTSTGFRSELYDLDSDAGEVNDVSGSLMLYYRRWVMDGMVSGISSQVRDPSNNKRSNDEKLIKKLKALGYSL